MSQVSNSQILTSIKNCKDISQAIAVTAKRVPKKIFIVNGNDKINFKDFDNLLNYCCEYFINLGLKERDIITIKIKNSVEFLILYFACIRAKIIVNPIPSTVSDYEAVKKFYYLNSKLFFVDDTFSIKKKNIIFINKNFHNSFIKFLKNKCDTSKQYNVKYNPRKTAVLYYSSGTTSDPKIIEYSYYSMLELQKSIIRNKFTSSDTNHLCVLPFGHTSVLRYSIKQAAILGSTIYIYDNFWNIKNNFWKIIKNKNINFVQLVPTLIISLLNLKKIKIKNKNKKLFIGCGSAVLSNEIQKEFENKFGVKLLNLFGLSEIGASHFENLHSRKAGSIGKPLDIYKVKIVNSKKKNCRINEPGELIVKSRALFNGYYKNEKLTSKSFYRNYFLTGDICKKDKDGFFYYVDRKKDIIIKGGVNILPSEIDEQILGYSKNVLEVATIGEKNQFYGEIVKSFIILKKNNKNFIFNLKTFLLKRLGYLKCPDIIKVIKKFPKTPSGKIIKRLLKNC